MWDNFLSSHARTSTPADGVGWGATRTRGWPNETHTMSMSSLPHRQELQPPTVGDDDANTRLRLRAQQCAVQVAYSAAPRQVQDDAGATQSDLSDNRSDVRAIREFLFTPSLDLPQNCRARCANFVAQEHHAHHTKDASTKRTSLCASANLAAVEDAPAQAPTIAELASNALAVRLQAQIDAIKKCQSEAEQAAAMTEQAAAAESTAPSMSHSGRSILGLEGQQRNHLFIPGKSHFPTVLGSGFDLTLRTDQK